LLTRQRSVERGDRRGREMTMALALVTELAELLGTSEDEAVAALRAALRQHKAEEARARVAFARAASAPILQVVFE